MEIEFAAITHKGKVKSTNQDKVCVNGKLLNENIIEFQGSTLDCDDIASFAIFDGMGGTYGGDIASKIAAESFLKENSKNANRICFDINQRICKYASIHSISSIGTTAAISIFSDNRVIFCNIGDSKILRISENKIEQISQDHVLMVGNNKRILTQYLGVPVTEMLIEPTCSFASVKTEEFFLLCSDGLTDMIPKGTYNYMSPEVFNSKKYDSRADIYSLGIVMYRILNNNRLPFIDPEKQIVKYSEREEAFEKRMRGEKIPPLKNVSEDLNKIILRASEYKQEERFNNIEDFQDALIAIKSGNKFRFNKVTHWVKNRNF